MWEYFSRARSFLTTSTLLEIEEPLQHFLCSGGAWISSCVPEVLRESVNQTVTYCLDRSSTFLANYAQDLPIHTTLPLAWQVDYTDPQYWEAHFMDASEELLETGQTFASAPFIETLRIRLTELQALIGPRMVSPVEYHLLLQRVVRLFADRFAVQSLVEEQALILAARMQADPKIAVQCFHRDLEGLLQEKKATPKFRRKAQRTIQAYGRWIALPQYAHYLQKIGNSLFSEKEWWQSKLNRYYMHAQEQQLRDRRHPIFMHTQRAGESEQESEFGLDSSSALIVRWGEDYRFSAWGLLGLLGAAYGANEWVSSSTTFLSGAASTAISSVLLSHGAHAYPLQTVFPLFLGGLSLIPSVAAQGDLVPPGPRGMEFQVNTQTQGEQWNVDVAPLSDGGFVVAWTSYYAAGHSDVRAQFYDAGGSLMGGECVMSASNDLYSTPAIAAFSWGGVVVAWNRQLADNNDEIDILARVFNSSCISLTEEWQVNRQSVGSQEHVDLTVLVDDTFVATWLDTYTGTKVAPWTPGVYAQIYSLNVTNLNLTSVGENFAVSQSGAVSNLSIKVVGFSSGGFIIIWGGLPAETSLGPGILGRCYSSASFEPISEPVMIASSQLTSLVSLNPLQNGTVVVGWLSPVEPYYSGVYARTVSDQCQLLSSPFLVNQRSQETIQSLTGSGSLINGNFVMLWTVQNVENAYWQVYGQVYSSDLKILVPEFPINQFFLKTTETTSVCGLNDGGFIIVWAGGPEDGSVDGVFGRRYNSQFGPIKVDQTYVSQVDWYAPWHQENSAIASFSDGGFVVAWWSARGDDADHKDIHAQIYSEGGVIERIQFALSPAVENHQWMPKMATLSNGNFVVIWIDRTSTLSSSLQGQIHDRHGEVVISKFTVSTTDPTFCDIAALQPEGFIAVWQAPSGDFDVTERKSGSFSVASRLYYDNEAKDFSGIHVFLGKDGKTFLTPKTIGLTNGGFAICLFYQQLDWSVFGYYELFSYNRDFTQINGVILGNDLPQLVHTDMLFSASLAVLSNGNIVAYWSAFTDIDLQYLGSYIQTYNSLGFPQSSTVAVNIDAYLNNASAYVLTEVPYQVFALGESDFILTAMLLQGDDGNSCRIITFRYFDPQASMVGLRRSVGTYPGRYQFYPQGVGLQDGGFVITWTQDNSLVGNGYGIFATRYNAERYEQPLQEGLSSVLVNLRVKGDQDTPDVLALPNGNFIIFWGGWTEENDYDVYAGCYNSAGQRLLFQNTSDALLLGSLPYYQGSPRATVLANLSIVAEASIVVSWVEDVGTLFLTGEGNVLGGTDVYMQKYDLTGNVKSEIVRVNTFYLGYQDTQDISANSRAGNDFFVTWVGIDKSTTTTTSDIYGKRFNEDLQPLGKELVVNNFTLGSQTLPRVALLNDNNVAVIWLSQVTEDGEQLVLYGRIVGKNNQFLTDDFSVDNLLLSDTKTTVLNAGGVCAMQNGGFAVAWTLYDTREPLTISTVIKVQVFGSDYQPIGNNTEVTRAEITSDCEDSYDLLSVADLECFSDDSILVTWLVQVYPCLMWPRETGNYLYGQKLNNLGKAIGLPIMLDGSNYGDTYVPPFVFSGDVLLDGSVVQAWPAIGQDDPSDPLGLGVYMHLYFPNLELKIPGPVSAENGLAYKLADSIRPQSNPTIVISDTQIGLAWEETQINGTTLLYWQLHNVAGTLLTAIGGMDIPQTVDYAYRPQLLFLSDNRILVAFEQQNTSCSLRSIHAGIVTSAGEWEQTPLVLEGSSEIEHKNAAFILLGTRVLMAWEHQASDREAIAIQSFDVHTLASMTPVFLVENVDGYHRGPQIVPWQQNDFKVWWSRYSQNSLRLDNFYDVVYMPCNGTTFVPLRNQSISYLSNLLDDIGISMTCDPESVNRVFLGLQSDAVDGWDATALGDFVDNSAAESFTLYDAQAVNTEVMREQTHIKVAVLREGSVVYVWQDDYYEKLGSDIYFQVYDAAANAVSRPQRANTYRIGDQTVPQIAALPDGGFVISWQSAQFNRRDAVFAQRFNRLMQAVAWEQAFSLEVEGTVFNYTEDQPAWLPLINSYSPYGNVLATLIFSNPNAGILQINTESSHGVSFGLVTINKTSQWQMSGYFNDVNTAWKTLQVIPTTDFNQSFTIEISTQDATTVSAPWLIHVDGIPVNDPPFILGSQIKAQYVEIGHLFNLSLSQFFYDVDDSVIRYVLGACEPISEYGFNATCQEISLEYLADTGDIGFPCDWLNLTGTDQSVLTGYAPKEGDWCILLQALDPSNATATAGVDLEASNPASVPSHLSNSKIVGIAVGSAAAAILGILLTYKGRQRYNADTPETRDYKNQLIQRCADDELADLRDVYLPFIVGAAIASWGQNYLAFNPSSEVVEDTNDNLQPSVYISIAEEDEEGHAWVGAFLIPHLERLGFTAYFAGADTNQQPIPLEERVVPKTTYVFVVPSLAYSQWYAEAESERNLIESALGRMRQDRRDIRCGDGSAVVVVFRPQMGYTETMLPEILRPQLDDKTLTQRFLPLFTSPEASDNMAVLFSLIDCLAPDLRLRIKHTENRFYSRANQIKHRTRPQIEKEIDSGGAPYERKEAANIAPSSRSRLRFFAHHESSDGLESASLVQPVSASVFG